MLNQTIIRKIEFPKCFVTQMDNKMYFIISVLCLIISALLSFMQREDAISRAAAENWMIQTFMSGGIISSCLRVLQDCRVICNLHLMMGGMILIMLFQLRRNFLFTLLHFIGFWASLLTSIYELYYKSEYLGICIITITIIIFQSTMNLVVALVAETIVFMFVIYVTHWHECFS